jgi:flagellar biosynthesis/type III secretory pathway protein FliH
MGLGFKMNREIQSFLNTLELELEEEMRQPVDLQLLNWLDGFLREVWEDGAKNPDAGKEYFDNGFEKGYQEAKDDFAGDYDGGYNDGFTNGKREGLKEGFEEGHKEGFREGLEEYDEYSGL